MNRHVVKTEDGSMTLFVPDLGEHYHSIHGAQTESKHIFIEAAFRQCRKEAVRVLEFGMGTGLNVLLTYLESKNSHRKVFFHSIEKYPLEQDELLLIKKSGLSDSYDVVFDKIHDCPWDRANDLSENFILYKELCDFRQTKAAGRYDIIYFDAFSPEVQADLWSKNIFEHIYKLASPGAILTTYSAKGDVKRNLKAAGFSIEKLPGPPGKREFIRAIKPGEGKMG